jgi:hypothetical protein
MRCEIDVKIKLFRPVAAWLICCAMMIFLSAPSSYGATAAANDSQLTSADKLVALMKYDTVLKDTLRRCKELAGTIGPENYVKSNPNIFGGIAPGSVLWPEVVGAFTEFYNETCSYLGENKLLASMAQAYSSNMTERELEDVIKFYSSPIGQKLVVASVAANTALQRTSIEQMPEITKKANAHLSKTLADLAEKNEKSRRKPWWRFW